MAENSFFILSAAAWLAFLHALAPDHWMPFVALAKASFWTRWRLAFVSFLAGTGHVLSSLAIGLIGISLGKNLGSIQGLEEHRENIATLLLIGFGVAYMAWGIKHARHAHHHEHLSIDQISNIVRESFVRRFWVLFAIIIFGPCEPLIPLMFLAWAKGTLLLGAMLAVFSSITIAMVVLQSVLAFEGLTLFASRHEKALARYAHTLAGASILVIGLVVILLGF